MRVKAYRLFVVIFYGILTFQLHAQAPAATRPDPVTLFQNVRVLNRMGQLSAPSNVLVRGNLNRAHLNFSDSDRP